MSYDQLQTPPVSSSSLVSNENLGVQGAGTSFTLANTPVSGTLKLYRGGARQKLTDDYTLSGVTITLLVALVGGEILIADYQK